MRCRLEVGKRERGARDITYSLQSQGDIETTTNIPAEAAKDATIRHHGLVNVDACIVIYRR